MCVSFALQMILVPRFCVCAGSASHSLVWCPTSYIHPCMPETQPKDGTGPLPVIKELHYLFLQTQDLYFCCVRDVWLVWAKLTCISSYNSYCKQSALVLAARLVGVPQILTQSVELLFSRNNNIFHISWWDSQFPWVVASRNCTLYSKENKTLISHYAEMKGGCEMPAWTKSCGDFSFPLRFFKTVYWLVDNYLRCFKQLLFSQEWGTFSR